MAVLHIRHLTRYRYGRAVSFGDHRLMLRPRESAEQQVLDFKLRVAPDAEVRERRDSFGNWVGLCRPVGRATEAAFESQVVVRHEPAALAPDCGAAIAPDGRALPSTHGADDTPDLLQFVRPAHADPTGATVAFARRFLRSAGPTPLLPLLAEMSHGVRDSFRYAPRLDGGARSPPETLEAGSGACRDFAVLMIEAVRSLGLAARFVSGYLHDPSPGCGGLRGSGHTHAWAQVHVPGCGWVDVATTNGVVGSRDLVRVAMTRESAQAAPLTGVYHGRGDEPLGLEVDIEVGLAAGAEGVPQAA